MSMHLAEGHDYIIATGTGTADNSGGASPADIDVTITINDIRSVDTILGIYGGPCQGYTVESIDGNQVTVNVKQVPAGATATITIVVAGYTIG